MVYLGGPRKRRGAGPKGLYLHDPPPGYRPPAPQISEKDLQRKVRQDWILMRATTVILVLTAFAFILIITAIIATH